MPGIFLIFVMMRSKCLRSVISRVRSMRACKLSGWLPRVRMFEPVSLMTLVMSASIPGRSCRRIRKSTGSQIGEQFFQLRSSGFGSHAEKVGVRNFLQTAPHLARFPFEQAAADFRGLASLDGVDVMADLAPRA